MNKKFYAFMLTPLLFLACNNSEAPAPSTKTSTQVESAKETTEQKVETPVASSSIKFINKPIVIEQGMLHINGFMGTLKPTLKSVLKQDPTHATAMGVCASIAMDMTDSYNATTTDTKVRRTAIKYRNPKNKPDATDLAVMTHLKNAQDFTKPVAVDMGDKYRVYKGIPTQKTCLICHGSEDTIKPEVLKIIKQKYPKDMATGFVEGEFRGAVVAEIKK